MKYKKTMILETTERPMEKIVPMPESYNIMILDKWCEWEFTDNVGESTVADMVLNADVVYEVMGE